MVCGHSYQPLASLERLLANFLPEENSRVPVRSEARLSFVLCPPLAIDSPIAQYDAPHTQVC